VANLQDTVSTLRGGNLALDFGTRDMCILVLINTSTSCYFISQDAKCLVRLHCSVAGGLLIT
jgi:hypothetical protein